MPNKLNAFIVLLLVFITLLSPISINAASDWQKSPINPIFSEIATSWDSYYVRSPNVSKINNVYKMWYEANSGNGGYHNPNGIGYASSLTGISEWTRTNQAVLSPGSLDYWEKATPEPFVLFDQNLGIYKMWYTSFNTDHWTYGLDRFRTRYATSIDGINWVKGDWVLYGTPGTWDEGGTNRGRSIIYKDGIYHMWYAGTNSSNLGPNSYWRIGYATSTDGIHWNKENSGNPVIEPTEPWEFNNSAYSTSDFPTVIFSGGLYHMWYGVGIGDDISQIAYAYSADGINWVKPADKNPALQRTPDTFDETYISPYTVLQEDNLLKMWYSGYKVYVPNVEGHWRIGYATASASILPTSSVTPTPTFTPTPTATPTATPTPTPTPTPPPPPTKKVIVIPGFAASWNTESMLSCNLLNIRGWGLNILAKFIYDPLLGKLSESGYQVLPFYYDWRKQIPTNATRLSNFIQANTGATEKINIVGHSMGGLVARAYVENKKTDSKIDKLLTVGSPHRGVLLSYGPWAAGRVTNDLLWRYALTFLLKHCGGIQGNDRLTIRSLVPSIKNMLPIFNYLRDQATGLMKPENSMVDQNNWIVPSNFAYPFYGVTVGTLSGKGFATPRTFVVTPRSAQDAFWGNWIDGKPVQTEKVLNGDGTVILSSSRITGAINRTIAQTHNDLMNSSKGIGEILNFFGSPYASSFSLDASIEDDSPMETSIAEAISQETGPKSALVIVGYPASFWVTSPDGTITRDTDGMVAIPNPQTGPYRVKLVPTSDSTLFIVTQLLNSGENLYKEYTFNNTSTKYYTLQFGTANPTEDILH